MKYAQDFVHFIIQITFSFKCNAKDKFLKA